MTSPSATVQSPHAVGFGITVTPTAAKKNKSAASPKKMRPITISLVENGNTASLELSQNYTICDGK